MPIFSRTVLLVILLTAVAGAVGGWAGVRYGLSSPERHVGLDGLIHGKLRLSPAQAEVIQDVEAKFVARRRSLVAQMRAANRELAAAIRREPEFGDGAKAAIMRYHAAESLLQQETVMHVLAIRRVLDAAQARQFDEEMSRALTAQ